MRKTAIILLLSLYSFGTLFCPLGDFAYMQYLPEMYAHCAQEDPDINAADFVFEHLMNLEDVFSHFENDADEGERPHQPFLPTQVVQHVVVMNNAFYFTGDRKIVISPEKAKYPLRDEQWAPVNYLSDIFRPPIV